MSETQNIPYNTLLDVLGKMLSTRVLRAGYEARPMKGGTLGDVRLVTGTAEAADGRLLPYRVVYKTQRKWARPCDAGSWRREYDLYTAMPDTAFEGPLRRPKCYAAQQGDDEIQLWLEYIDGISGADLTVDMLEQAALALGRLQGRLYAQRPPWLMEIANLSGEGFLRDVYERYRTWPVARDYIRAADCEIPAHLRGMITAIDDDAGAVFARIGRLPVVLCHRDFWHENIFYRDDEIVLIDWDTAGWGYLGEDMASLIADELDARHMAASYARCVPAYYKGFGEYAQAPDLAESCVYELILVMFGYRLVDWYMHARTSEGKDVCLGVLQRIYEMGR